MSNIKVKINQHGMLLLKRKDKFKLQICPFDATDEGTEELCGDWCPLFREPIVSGVHVDFGICRRDFTLYASEFKDER
jgi:hypothetical protein